MNILKEIFKYIIYLKYINIFLSSNNKKKGNTYKICLTELQSIHYTSHFCAICFYYIPSVIGYGYSYRLYDKKPVY